MKCRSIILLVIVFCSINRLFAQDTLLDLRKEHIAAKSDGVSGAEFASLSERTMNLADGAGQRRRFWDALGFLAELCDAGPYEETDAVRARALDLLSKRFTDTHSWSSLVSSLFAPVLERMPGELWRRHITAYDDVLDTLGETTKNERVKAELLYAKVVLRVQINRRWDWLTEQDRHATLQILRQIQDEYGTLPCPGSRGAHMETVGARAAAHEYELRRLNFGAPAPRTVGVDLKGKPLDVAELKGNIVLLDFWTSFCTPCLAMVPDMRRLLDKYENEPVVYVGVNGDSQREQGLRTAKRLNMSWRNLWDGRPEGPDGPIAAAWRVDGWPALFVIDGKGKIRHKFWGKDAIDSGLESAIKSLLDERARRSQ